MKISAISFLASLVGEGLCLVGPYAPPVQSQDQPATEKTAAEGKEAVGKLDGTWELVECDYRRTIDYHPESKVSPGYAMLMFAFTAANPEKGSDKHVLQWHCICRACSRFSPSILTGIWKDSSE